MDSFFASVCPRAGRTRKKQKGRLLHSQEESTPSLRFANGTQSLFAEQPAADGLTRAAAGTGGKNNRCRTGNDVTAGKDIGYGGLSGFLVHFDISAFGLLEILRGLKKNGSSWKLETSATVTESSSVSIATWV